MFRKDAGVECAFRILTCIDGEVRTSPHFVVNISQIEDVPGPLLRTELLTCTNT
jgi:hypothetical protein